MSGSTHQQQQQKRQQHQRDASSSSLPQSSSSTTSPLVESLLTGERQGVGGILCNDHTGLCLVSMGATDAETSGVYTNLARLSSQLRQHLHHQRQQQQGSDSSVVAVATDSSPLITIEMDDAAILVKEYDGHAVAVRVPSSNREANAGK